jgi:uncharacterized protein (TIGR02145 family)
MADWAAGSNESSIKNSILSWELSSSVPNFEKYVKNYWYTNYDLGACNASLEGSIKSNSKDVNYICKDNAWARADEYERDTYQWVCSMQGEIKDGQVSGAKYICKGNGWVLASEFEIDTYQWVCTEGEIKSGQASKTKYICKSRAWVLASEYEIDTYQWVCTEGEIKNGQASGTKYICKSKTWVLATGYEIDTYQWVCTEGEIKSGQASEAKYVCRNEEWQTPPNYIEEKCFESKSCLTFKDARDNQRYFSVVIGEQTWMAENLNYTATGSKCYIDLESNCDKYGRLYNWDAAMSACPNGWHLPSDDEWSALVNSAGGSSTAGRHLKATSGWNSNGNGLDTYGFTALPGGNGYSGGFDFVGNYGTWWSSTEFESDYAYVRYVGYNYEAVFRDYGGKYDVFSVRCAQD